MAITLQSSGVSVFDEADTGHVYTYAGGAAAAGDLLLIGVNVHNGTATTPTGFTIAKSDAGDQGCYCWYKVAAGGETSSTITTSDDREVSLSYLRYSGLSATPLDKVQAVRVTDTPTAGTQQSPAVTPASLTGSNELALLYSMNNISTSGTSMVPTWPAAYGTRMDTGPSPRGLGSDHCTQHFVAARTDASGSETPQITWTGGAFLNRTSLFVSFKPATSAVTNLAGTADIAIETTGTDYKLSKLAGTADITTTTTAAITKTASTTFPVRLLAVENSILTAVAAALVATPGGAPVRSVLTPSGDTVGTELNQLSCTVDRVYRNNTGSFIPDALDLSATRTYQFAVLVVSISRATPDDTAAALGAAAISAVNDAYTVLSVTASTLAGLGDVGAYQVGQQSYGDTGSAVTVTVRLS
jgi:hypothetical protein